MKNEKSLPKGKLTKQQLNAIGTLATGASTKDLAVLMNKEKRRAWAALFKDRPALVELVKQGAYNNIHAKSGPLKLEATV